MVLINGQFLPARGDLNVCVCICFYPFVSMFVCMCVYSSGGGHECTCMCVFMCMHSFVCACVCWVTKHINLKERFMGADRPCRHGVDCTSVIQSF